MPTCDTLAPMCNLPPRLNLSKKYVSKIKSSWNQEISQRISFWKPPFLAFGYLNDIQISHPAVATVTVSNYTLPFSPQTNIKRLSQFAPFSLISFQISQTRKRINLGLTCSQSWQSRAVENKLKNRRHPLWQFCNYVYEERGGNSAGLGR